MVEEAGALLQTCSSAPSELLLQSYSYLGASVILHARFLLLMSCRRLLVLGRQTNSRTGPYRGRLGGAVEVTVRPSVASLSPPSSACGVYRCIVHILVDTITNTIAGRTTAESRRCPPPVLVHGPWHWGWGWGWGKEGSNRQWGP